MELHGEIFSLYIILESKYCTVKLNESTQAAKFFLNYYYMANPALSKSLCSEMVLLGQDFEVRTVSIETVQPVSFCYGVKPANLKFATKTEKQKPVNIVILHSETTRRS